MPPCLLPPHQPSLLPRPPPCSKAPIQAFADRVSAVFVPAVAALALLTWAAWFAAGTASWYPRSWLPQVGGRSLRPLAQLRQRAGRGGAGRARWWVGGRAGGERRGPRGSAALAALALTAPLLASRRPPAHVPARWPACSPAPPTQGHNVFLFALLFGIAVLVIAWCVRGGGRRGCGGHRCRSAGGHPGARAPSRPLTGASLLTCACAPQPLRPGPGHADGGDGGHRWDGRAGGRPVLCGCREQRPAPPARAPAQGRRCRAHARLCALCHLRRRGRGTRRAHQGRRCSRASVQVGGKAAGWLSRQGAARRGAARTQRLGGCLPPPCSGRGAQQRRVV